MARIYSTETETFIKVVELSSFTRAAEALNIARTVASKHVADLEAGLGVGLLNRTTRSISLTEAGQEYLERAKVALALLGEARSIASNLGVTPSGRLRLNAPMSFGVLHVAPAIPQFLDAYPGVLVDLTLNDRVVDLVEEGYDIAIRIGHLKESSLIARRLAPCRMAGCAAPSYLTRKGRPSHPRELSSHDCLIYTYWSERDVWRFTRNGEVCEVKIGGPLSSNNGDSLLAAAVGGAGIIFQPTFIVGDALRDGRLEPVLADWSTVDLGIHAMFPPGRTPSLKARAFADHLGLRFRREPYWDRDL